MKDFKGAFDTVQDIYEAFLNGGESGWFALAGGAFYEWKNESWKTVEYTSLTTWDIPIGNWLSVNVANPPTGLPLGTYQIVSYKDYLDNTQTYCFGVWLYKIDGNVATRVSSYKKTYTENEFTQSTASQIQDIPLLKYQKDKAESIEELYLRYPNGGEDGWYALITDLNVFAYWEAATEEWKPMAGDPVQADWATQAGAEAGVNNSTIMTPLRTKQAILANHNGDTVIDPDYVHTDNNFTDSAVLDLQEAYDHTQIVGNPHGITSSDLGLGDVEDGAQINKIETIQKNGVDLPITGKKVNVVIPTQPSDIGAATAGHNHTLASLSEKSYNSLTDLPNLSLLEDILDVDYWAGAR